MEKAKALLLKELEAIEERLAGEVNLEELGYLVSSTVEIAKALVAIEG